MVLGLVLGLVSGLSVMDIVNRFNNVSVRRMDKGRIVVMARVGNV